MQLLPWRSFNLSSLRTTVTTTNGDERKLRNEEPRHQGNRSPRADRRCISSDSERTQDDIDEPPLLRKLKLFAREVVERDTDRLGGGGGDVRTGCLGIRSLFFFFAFVFSAANANKCVCVCVCVCVRVCADLASVSLRPQSPAHRTSYKDRATQSPHGNHSPTKKKNDGNK